MQLQLRVSGVEKVETEDLGSGSQHRFTLVFPVPADRDMPPKTLPWRELEFEGAGLASDSFPESTQSPHMTGIEAESTVAVLVQGDVGKAEPMGTSLLHRYGYIATLLSGEHKINKSLVQLVSPVTVSIYPQPRGSQQWHSKEGSLCQLLGSNSVKRCVGCKKATS